MDGYTLTSKMRQARRSFRFTAVEQALFYELVAVCNGEDWRDVFDCSNIELCFAIGIQEKTLIKARETLINSGLIFYQSGKSKRQVGRYSFTTPFATTVNNTGDNTADKGANGTADKGANEGTNTTDLYKHKTKQNKTKEDKEKPKRFSPPSIEEINNFFIKKGLSPEDSKYRSESFFAFYDSKNWMVGKNKMSNWKSAASRSLEWEDRRTSQFKSNFASHDNSKQYSEF